MMNFNVTWRVDCYDERKSFMQFFLAR
jgi:hypothetical protein